MSNIQSAPPPLSTLILISFVAIIGFISFSLFESVRLELNLYQIVTPAVWYGNNIFKVKRLAWIRIAISCFIFGVTLRSILVERWQHKTSYLASSNLQSYPIELKGLRTQSYLTAWCWNLLGLSFFINGLVLSLLIPIDDIHTTTNDDSYLYYYSGKHGHYAYPSSFFSRSLLHMSPICFEIAAPMSMLVSAVIKYAIWPRLFQKGGPTKTTDLKRFTNLMSHNMNVIFVFIEVGFLGNLSVDIKHIFVAPIFGMTYALYSYCMASRWTPGNGAQFLYFFLDTTLGLTSTKALFGLFLVLILFYVIFWAICEMIFSYTRRLLLRAVIVFVISRFFCKFRD